MALNMFDEMEKNKLKLDKDDLSKLVGIVNKFTDKYFLFSISR